jgi:hypothetical protein
MDPASSGRVAYRAGQAPGLPGTSSQAKEYLIMKKVRYAAGALGVAPGLGMLMMTPHAVPAPTAGHGGKTVVLQTRAGTDSTTCDGSKPEYAHSLFEFWYKVDPVNTCIGTVKFFGDGPGRSGSEERVRIWGYEGTSRQTLSYSNVIGGSAPYSWPVHRWFKNEVKVCFATRSSHQFSWNIYSCPVVG